MRPALSAACVLCAGALALLPQARPAAPPRPAPHTSPVDLALLPDGTRAVTANHTADSVSLIDLSSAKLLHEQPCGARPAAVACSRDGKRIAVSNLWAGTVSLFAVAGNALKPAGSVAVGPLPRGLAFAAGGLQYVAVSGADKVVTIDPASRKVTRSWPAPREPYTLAVSADGKRLAAASTRSGHVRLWDLSAGKLLWARKVEDAFNLRGLAFTPDGKALTCAQVVPRDCPAAAS